MSFRVLRRTSCFDVTSGIDMAFTDFLKKALTNPLDPLASTSALFQPKVTGSEPLNPEALAIRQARPVVAPAPILPVVAPTQPLITSTRLGGSGGLTGGAGNVPTPLTQPVDPATAQLQQEAENLAKYGTANAPEAPGVLNPPTTGETEVPTSPDGTAYTETPKFADTYRSIYESLGLGDIRSQLDTTGLELQELQDKKVEEISLINENPWLTEGQRQDRVNAINKKYEQKEGNLINRIDLFQSTFEQGRQEAQFIASQTAEDQREEREVQRDALERQMEAERKLAESGQEVLSVADARALGVPYGTTIEQAQKLGIIPMETSSGGDNPNRVLSATEAGLLGVPYGTTASEAYGKSATAKPTVEESKARQFAVAAENADRVLAEIGYDPGLIEISQLPNVFKGEKRQQFEQAARAFVNATLRRESGATITDSEFTNKYKELIDQAGDSPAVKLQKADARRAAVQSIKEAGRLGTSDGQETVSSVTPEEFQQLKKEFPDLSDEYIRSLGFSGVGGDTNQATVKGYRETRRAQEIPQISSSGRVELQNLKIGNNNVLISKSIAGKLARAQAEFKRITGRNLQINQSFRTHEQQARLYKELSAKGARVAPPGKSFHETGLAIDVTNWKEAEKILRKYGFKNDLADDKGHFSIGET